MLGQAADAALSHPLFVSIAAPLCVLGIGALVRSLLRISKAVTVDIPASLRSGERRMGRIEEAAAGLRNDLVKHMEHEEREGAEWRREVRDQIDDVRKASVMSVARLIEAIESGDPVGRASSEGDPES
jgi:hypothetical protein